MKLKIVYGKKETAAERTVEITEDMLTWILDQIADEMERMAEDVGTLGSAELRGYADICELGEILTRGNKDDLPKV